MHTFCISALIKIMMEELGENQIRTGSMILNTVAACPELDIDISDKMISRLVHRIDNVPQKMKMVIANENVLTFAREQVEKDILPAYPQFSIDDSCWQILQLLNNDATAGRYIRQQLQQFYETQQYSDFLSTAILYALSKPNKPEKEFVQETDYFLLAETGYRCPLDGEQLWKPQKDKYKGNYQIISIYPDELDEKAAKAFNAIRSAPSNKIGDQNKIALCKKCAEEYQNDPDPKTYERLLECKGFLKRQNTGMLIAGQVKLESEIRTVIEALSQMEGESENAVFSQPLEIDEKIQERNSFLRTLIKGNVVNYYSFVAKQFALMEETHDSSFEEIRLEVATCYTKYAKNGYSQAVVFQMLADWIIKSQGLSDEFRLAAEVVVSFFVQNCAVFKKKDNNHDISE